MAFTAIFALAVFIAAVAALLGTAAVVGVFAGRRRGTVAGVAAGVAVLGCAVAAYCVVMALSLPM